MNKRKTTKQLLSSIKNKILDLVFPKDIKCCFCGEELNSKAKNRTCVGCCEKLPFIKNPCLKCGSEMENNTQGLCLKCSKNNMDFLLARAVFCYEDRPMSLVRKVKYEDSTQKIENMVDYMVECFNQHKLSADIVTFVPMTERKEKWRGFNQSKLIAEEFAKRVQLPVVETCKKIVDNESQTDLNFSKRKQNVKDNFKFVAESKSEISCKTVLIIDDVVTTGATVNEIARILKLNGARECLVLSFAHTRIKQDN